jgi:O-antigen chain-terminating methyltransferase
MNGLKASCGDGADYMAKMKTVDGIFVGQVVEHLKTGEIIRLCETAYEKLEKGGCIIIETPNPTSLSIYTNAFYIDPSHVKPVHPLTMQYLLEKAGFRRVEIVYTPNSRPPINIPELKINSDGSTEEFNKAMKQVSQMLFGSQDYSAIAYK